MAALCKDLCDTVNAIPSVGFTIGFESSTAKFSLRDKRKTSISTNPPAPNTADIAHDDDETKIKSEQGSQPEGQKEDKEAEVMSSDEGDMEGYESDTSSSSSGDDVVVEGYGDSEEEEEEVLEEDEEEALITARIEQLKVRVTHVHT